MYDKELVAEILDQTAQAAQKVIERFEGVADAGFFVNSLEGGEKLDAICMQLIVIGENLKNLDKVAGKELLNKYPIVDWRGAKGLRDVITHNYTKVNPQAVFAVCKNKIPGLLEAINRIIKEL
jgi:uncharacterized protein with HEPN domain